MEKNLADYFSTSSPNTLGDLLGKASRWLGCLHLLSVCICFSAFCSCTDAGWSRSECQPGRLFWSGHLRSLEDVHLQLLGRFHSVQSCQAACCQSPTCDAFWLVGQVCIQVSCTKPHRCWTFQNDAADSMLMFVKSEHVLDSQPLARRHTPLPGWLDWREGHRSKARMRRSLSRRAKRDTGSSSSGPASLTATVQPLDSKPASKDLSESRPSGQEANLPKDHVSPEKALQPSSNDFTGPDSKGPAFPMSNNVNRPSDLAGGDALRASTPGPFLATTFSSSVMPGLTVTKKAKSSNDSSIQPFSGEEAVPTSSSLQGEDAVKVQPVTPVPTSIPNNSSVTTAPKIPAMLPSTAVPTPVIKKLAVSAGDSVEVTLPKNEVELNAYVLPPPPAGTSYSYDWRLITHPTDYSGEMEGKHSRILKLSKLTVGLYEFKVIVEGDNAHGEGMVNVTVKPEPRVNQPPVAIASPQFLEISLPTTSTVIDGSQSTDDDKIVSYHWEELKGPLREEKVSADTAILKLTNLVPGNYTFSLTVVDSDGASSSTTASLTVNKAVDYPPVAIAGPNQVITLPQNSITLYGNQSTDDHGIVSYEWSLSPNSKGKVVEMQGVRTSTLQLSAMREGDYTYQLTVTDSAGHQSTANVTVIVQPENNKPPKADAGPNKELTLPVDSTTLDGSKSSDDQKIASYLWEKTQCVCLRLCTFTEEQRASSPNPNLHYTSPKRLLLCTASTTP